MPRAGSLVLIEVSRHEDGGLVLAYRERGSKTRGASLRLGRRGAIHLARVLEGTCHTESDEPARLELMGEVL